MSVLRFLISWTMILFKHSIAYCVPILMLFSNVTVFQLYQRSDVLLSVYCLPIFKYIYFERVGEVL